jgi:hypothetical protein
MGSKLLALLSIPVRPLVCRARYATLVCRFSVNGCDMIWNVKMKTAVHVAKRRNVDMSFMQNMGYIGPLKNKILFFPLVM